MKKKIALALAVLLACTALLPMAVFATETEGTTAPTEDASARTEAATEPTRAPDECGEGITWHYEDGVLTVSGKGEMDDFYEGAPWDAHRDDIVAVVFTGGVTYVGAEAFRDYDKLTTVDFGSSMHTIGERAFQSCEGLTKIQLPATFRRFSRECFEGCRNLKEVYCAGGMPSFNFNCLWNYTSITVYCPVNNPWPASAVEELETNFNGRLQVLLADGKDIFDFGTGETEPETEPTTQPTTEPTTVPTTEPATEPATEPTTKPSEETEATVPTTAPTEAPTEASPETEPAPTEEEAVDEDYLVGKSRIGVVIIAGVLTVLVAGALIFRASGRGGKYMR